MRCPIELIRARRVATWGGSGFTESAVTDDPVALWQRATDATGPYDLTLDTSTMTPTEAAEAIRRRLLEPPRPSALFGHARPAG